MNKMFRNDEKKRSSLLYRWEDQEIYYFSLGIKDFGKDYVKIAKIIQTKSATQLEKFYNDNHEKFLLSLSYEEFMNKNNPVPTGYLISSNLLKSLSLLTI